MWNVSCLEGVKMSSIIIRQAAEIASHASSSLPKMTRISVVEFWHWQELRFFANTR